MACFLSAYHSRGRLGWGAALAEPHFQDTLKPGSRQGKNRDKTTQMGTMKSAHSNIKTFTASTLIFNIWVIEFKPFV